MLNTRPARRRRALARLALLVLLTGPVAACADATAPAEDAVRICLAPMPVPGAPNDSVRVGFASQLLGTPGAPCGEAFREVEPPGPIVVIPRP